MTNNELADAVYDIVTADQLEDGDQIQYINDIGGIDYLENIKVTDSGDSIWVEGSSLVTGDLAHYCWPATQEVGLWSV